jgi:beta-aspartyl-peptidase (threonine type)
LQYFNTLYKEENKYFMFKQRPQGKNFIENASVNKMRVIMVHGGVDTRPEPQFYEVMYAAALAGHGALAAGLLDAAEEAVKVLEASPLFNAGYGAVLNRDGEVELDASIMDGSTGKFGAVAAIQSMVHPVSVARMVLEETYHVLLAGRGATEFALSRGFSPVDLRTHRMMESWQKATEKAKLGLSAEESLFTGQLAADAGPCDTVGCVVSHAGLTAAASSTGGYLMKTPGRVGDTPVPGAGIYASSRCAVTCTGLGEAFIETLTAKYIDSVVDQGAHPQEAAEKAVARLASLRAGTVAGIIVVDHLGRAGSAHNTRSFPVALVEEGEPKRDFASVKVR